MPMKVGEKFGAYREGKRRRREDERTERESGRREEEVMIEINMPGRGYEISVHEKTIGRKSFNQLLSSRMTSATRRAILSSSSERLRSRTIRRISGVSPLGKFGSSSLVVFFGRLSR